MIKAGFVQFQPQRCDVQANIRHLETLLKGVHADLLVLPELANSAYLYATCAELEPYCEPGDGKGPFLSALRLLATQSGALIVAGFAERAPNGLYNSAAAVDTSGVVHLYRKTHLFKDEVDLFLPGDSGLEVFHWHGVRIGMMICFDWIFPEAARTLALRGAQIIAHPVNLVLPYCQQAMLTRSLENAVFSITANRYGPDISGERSLVFTGASQLVDPGGQRLLQAPACGDSIQTCAIDPTRADEKHITVRNHLFHDRRPDLYQH